MLEEYKKNHARAIIQYVVLDIDGTVKESDDVLFSKIVNSNIALIHPFFESLLPLIHISNEEFLFSCIHINDSEKNIIADITLKTFDKKKEPLLIIQDLTSHYENYQTTAQVRNESIINSQVLELKNSYLLEKEEFKNAFIANFSHELRDPISGIITFGDILKKTPLSSEQNDYVGIIKSSSNYLKKMIDDILDISKIEVGKLKLILEPFNLLNLLNEIKASYEVKAKQNGLEFHSRFNDSLPEVIEGDAMRLRQVLTNLLDNAIKFTPSGSIHFNVSLNQIRAQKASIHFEVVDTGVGIEKEHLEDIFDSFSQINNTTSNTGSGLGLAIVKYLVELTNSKITIKSEPGKGSTFSTNVNFRLVSNVKKTKQKLEKEDIIKTNRKYNILLVDDSEITQLSVLKILAAQGHFFLDIVTHPDDVISRIENQEFDLVLMDIKINNHKGDEITQLIRKLPEREHKRIPVIALTARIFKEDLKRYKKAGMNDVIKKPFNEESLLEKIYPYLK